MEFAMLKALLESKALQTSMPKLDETLDAISEAILENRWMAQRNARSGWKAISGSDICFFKLIYKP